MQTTKPVKVDIQYSTGRFRNKFTLKQLLEGGDSTTYPLHRLASSLKVQDAIEEDTGTYTGALCEWANIEGPYTLTCTVVDDNMIGVVRERVPPPTTPAGVFVSLHCNNFTLAYYLLELIMANAILRMLLRSCCKVLNVIWSTSFQKCNLTS